MSWNALFLLVHSERYVDERLVSEFMLKFVYFQILFQFRTYIFFGTNLCRINRDKYLTVRKISTRSTQKIQIRTDVTWCCSSPSHKLSLTSESTPPSISISSSDYFGGVGSGLPCTRSHSTCRSFFLSGVAPSALTFFQLTIFFRSATDHLSTSFDVREVSSSLICCFLSLYSCMFFFYVPFRLRTYPPLDFKKTPLVQSRVKCTAFSDQN